jgi:alcohol dehydrogenase class IV
MYSIIQPKIIHMGRGAIKVLGDELTKLSPKKILVVTDSILQKLGVVDQALQSAGSHRDRMEFFFNTKLSPDIYIVENCDKKINEGSFDLVLGIGGGSPLDVAKGASVVAVHEGGIINLLGRNMLKRKGIPTVLIPTTSGTGSEVSQAAVLEVPEEGTKKPILDPKIVAEIAIVDPELAIQMPPALTAETGLDALYHAIEGFTARTTNPVAKIYSIEAVKLISRYLKNAYDNGKDMEAREAMSRAATLAGLGFSNGGLGAIHALALALESFPGISHGKGVTILGPWVMEFNRIGHELIYANIAEALGESVTGLDAQKASRKACEAVTRMAQAMGISPYLEDHGIQRQEIPQLAQKAFTLSQRLMHMNPKDMSKEDVLEIFLKAYGK